VGERREEEIACGTSGAIGRIVRKLEADIVIGLRIFLCLEARGRRKGEGGGRMRREGRVVTEWNIFLINIFLLPP
jgi:hypothetical protein